MSKMPTLVTRQQAQAPFFVGVDLGGTNIKVGLVDDLGQTLAYLKVNTNVELGPEDGSRRTGLAVNDVIQKAGLSPTDIARVGLGSPGLMDVPAGILLFPSNLPGWNEFPLRDRLTHYCGLPVTFANDANAAAYGEFWIGRGRELHSLVLLTLGTGIGSGIIIGGVSIRGEHCHGAECGHMIIDLAGDARRCSCGHTGHLEAYASAPAVVRRTAEGLQAGRNSSISARLAAGEELSALLLSEEAEHGDQFALEIVLDTAQYLGIAIVSLINIIDPSGIILGGAMDFGGPNSELGQRFLTRIREEVRRRGFAIPAERITIDFATLGGDAGYIGAAGLARRDYRGC